MRKRYMFPFREIKRSRWSVKKFFKKNRKYSKGSYRFFSLFFTFTSVQNQSLKYCKSNVHVLQCPLYWALHPEKKSLNFNLIETNHKSIKTLESCFLADLIKDYWYNKFCTINAPSFRYFQLRH